MTLEIYIILILWAAAAPWLISPVRTFRTPPRTSRTPDVPVHHWLRNHVGGRATRDQIDDFIAATVTDLQKAKK
jgi:hypothetical protein